MGDRLCVVLLSGGMDSCVTAAIAAGDHRVAALHVSYGQRTQARELRAFREIAAHIRAERTLVVSLESLSAIGGSCLTDHGLPVPQGDLSRTGSGSVPISYVPFRNTHLLASAVSWAEVIGADSVWIGAVEEDSSGYPDCRRAYFDAFRRLVQAGTRPGSSIAIETPLIGMRKSEIVGIGLEIGAPLHLSWSCYGESEAACGRCDSCLLRIRGFREAGREDPIPYAR
jgi:7-cyano-7-deazaguanine synthase